MKSALQGIASVALYNEPDHHEKGGGAKMVAAFRPVKLGGGNWVLVREQPVAQAYALIYVLRWEITVAGIIVGIAALAVALLLGRSGSRIRRW